VKFFAAQWKEFAAQNGALLGERVTSTLSKGREASMASVQV
jgi:hypothetical protein